MRSTAHFEFLQTCLESIYERCAANGHSWIERDDSAQGSDSPPLDEGGSRCEKHRGGQYGHI